MLLPQFVSQPAAPQELSFQQLLPIWQAAGQAYGVPWSVLAAINRVESNFGQNMGPSSAGAIGWMQFMPDTWARWGVDANGDGIADPWNAEDAIYSAARYLAASGAATDLASAVFSYNHAQWYVDEVLQLAQGYDSGGADYAAALQAAQQTLDAAKQAVVDASQRLLDANALVTKLQAEEDGLAEAAQNAPDVLEPARRAEDGRARGHPAAVPPRTRRTRAASSCRTRRQRSRRHATARAAPRSRPGPRHCSARRATPTATSSRSREAPAS